MTGLDALERRLAAVGETLESPAETDEPPLVAYRLEGEPKRIVHVDAPIRSADGDPLVLHGAGGNDLRLTLEAEDGERVVVVIRR